MTITTSHYLYLSLTCCSSLCNFAIIFSLGHQKRFNRNKIFYYEHHNETHHKPVLEKLARIFLHSLDKSLYPL